MPAWKIDRTMAIWGIAFGIFAIVTGTLLLSAVNGGFLAEGFFLIVLSWVFFFVVVAMFVSWVERRSKKEGSP